MMSEASIVSAPEVELEWGFGPLRLPVLQEQLCAYIRPTTIDKASQLVITGVAKL